MKRENVYMKAEMPKIFLHSNDLIGYRPCIEKR